MQRQSHINAVARYNEKNMKQVKINLNVKTDQDVIDKLKTVDSIAGYIKTLIRADMSNNPG